MVQGYQGAARLQHRTQAGLVRERELRTGLAEKRYELSVKKLRETLQ